jgi:broad specificity phosphatase PhoE
MPRNRSQCTVLLIRHVHTETLGVELSGRQRGVSLSALGLRQAAALGRGVASRTRLAAIYSSPLLRARLTAAVLAHSQRRHHVTPYDGLNEIDFGRWTGQRFDALERDAAWQRFNRSRAAAHIPGGEDLPAAQARSVAAVRHLAASHPRSTIALVTHAEIIRSIVLHCRDWPLDWFDRVPIDPGSITTVSVEPHGICVIDVNDSKDVIAGE